MPKAAEKEILAVAGREVAISNPRKVLFPQAGYTKLDLARYYLAVADGALRGAGGRPNVLVRYPNGIDGEFFFQKRAPRVAARLDRGRRRCSFPSGRTAEEVVPRDAAALAVDGEPRLPRAASASGARRRSRSSRRAARRSRSGARRRVAADPRGRRGRARDARRLRPGRLAEDVRLARHARLRAHRAALDLRRGAPRGAGARARGRAARAGARDEQVVEGGAPRRVPRLQPEREGPHDRQRLLGAADGRRARVGAARRGTRSTTATPPTSRSRRCRRGSRSSAIGTPASTSTPCSLEALLELSARQEREGLGDAPWPPHYRKQAGEPPRVAAVDDRRDAGEAPSADRDRPRARRRTTRSPASSAGRRAIPTRRRTSSRPTSWSTRCAAASRRGRASASTCSTCPRRCGRAQEPLDPDDDAERLERRQRRTTAAAPKTFSSS